MYRRYERYCCNEVIYDEGKTELQLSGLDPEKLEFMRMDERRKVLIEAGLNPDCYDF